MRKKRKSAPTEAGVVVEVANAVAGIPKTANRNRTAGHTFERMAAQQLAIIYPNIGTSRFYNQARDGQKVDLCNKDEAVHGRMSENYQCKNVKGTVNYHRLLAEMPDIAGVENVVLHNYTEAKVLKNGKTQFYTKGIYAILKYPFLIWLLRYRKGYEILRKNIDAMDPETKAEVEQQLEEIGL